MSAAVPRETNFGRAALVEQCSCPTGYTGTSCEVCFSVFHTFISQ